MTNTPASQAFHMLVEMAVKSVDWSTIQAVYGWAMKQGELSADMAAPDGSRLLLAMVKGTHGRMAAPAPPPSLVEQILKHDSQAMVQLNSNGSCALDRVLAFFENNTGHQPPGELSWWLSNAPLAALEGYRHRNESLSGFSVAALVIDAERGGSDVDETVGSALGAWFGRGFDPNASYGPNEPFAQRLRTPAQWASFLAAGGNPDQMATVHGYHKGKTMPLWQVLLEQGPPALNHSLVQWAQVNRSQELSDYQASGYWQRLSKDSISGHMSASEVIKRLSAHPDWITLRDPEGRTPAMFGISMHSLAWKALAQKRLRTQIHARDNAGRGLWHYAVLRLPRLANGTFDFLDSQGVSADPSPVTGRGLLATMMLDGRDCDGHLHYQGSLYKTRHSTSLIRYTTSHQWVAVAEDDVGQMAAAMACWVGDEHMRSFLQQILRKIGDDPCHPVVRYMLTALATDKDLIARQAACDMRPPDDLEVVEKLRQHAPLPGHLESLTQAVVLAKTMGPVSGGAIAPKPRSRARI